MPEVYDHHVPQGALSPFDSWLFELDDDAFADLRLSDLQQAATAAGIEMPQLTILTVIDDGTDPLALLQATATGVLEARHGPQSGLIRARSGAGEFVVATWRVEQGVQHLIGSVPVTDDSWKRVEQAWMNAAAPHLSPVILNRDDFETIGDGLAEHGEIAAARMTARVLRDHSSYSRGWPNLPVVRRPTHREALSETAGMLVRTLTLDVGSYTRVHLRRTSGASFYRGDWRLFVDVVLRRLQIAAAERRELLSGRERTPGTLPPAMLSMDIDRVDLSDPIARKAILSTMTAVHGFQAAIMREDPYLHLLVSDFLNGTSFDLLVTGDGRLDILPGLRSAVGSLARATDALGDALGMRELSLREVTSLVDDNELLAL